MADSKPFIVGMGGTLRAGSSSERALAIILRMAEAQGAETMHFVGEDLALPIYNPQPGAKLAPAADRLISALRKADGLILASPCYHGGVSGLLKNAIDYTEEMRTDARVYLDGMPVGCVGCGMGYQGPNSAVANLRSIAHSLRAWPTPLGIAINTGVTKFEGDGCSDDGHMQQFGIMAKQVVDFARMRKAKQAA